MPTPAERLTAYLDANADTRLCGLDRLMLLAFQEEAADSNPRYRAADRVLMLCCQEDFTLNVRPGPDGWQATAGHRKGEGTTPWAALLDLANLLDAAPPPG